MSNEEFPFPCGTVFLLFYHNAVFLGVGVFGIIAAIFCEIKPYVWTLIAQTAGFLLLFFLVIGILAGLLQCLLKIWKVEKHKSARISLMVGFSLVFILTTIPRVLIFFVPGSNALFYYGLIILPLSSTLIFALFNLPIFTLYKFDTGSKYGSEMSIIPVLMFFPFVFFVPAMRFATLYPKDQLESIVGTQFTYFILTFPLTFELAMVVMGKLVLRKPKDGNKVVQKTSKTVMIEPVVETDPRLECKICLLPFSEFTRIPRILRSCGHTVCEACAKNLLKKNNNTHLFCPFCQTATVVKGSVGVLTKNHAALACIRELRRNR